MKFLPVVATHSEENRKWTREHWYTTRFSLHIKDNVWKSVKRIKILILKKNKIYYLGRISCSPLALRTWGLAGVLLPDLTTGSFLLFFSIWSESTDESTTEVFVSSFLLRFTEPILEKLVSKVWLEDIGVLHDTESSNDKGKKVGKEKWTMCMSWSSKQFRAIHRVEIVFLNQPG